MDAIVVGAGLFGQVITKHLRSLGMDVLMIDNNSPNSASKPSASLMKPSWFAGMGAQFTDPALELLDQHYGVQEIQFSLGPAKLGGVLWCDPREILKPEAVHYRVCGVAPGVVTYEIPPMRAILRLEAPIVIVAAGVHTSTLVPVPGLVGKMGASCLFPNRQVVAPFIRPWAPYKQIVAFNLGEHVWIGDGSAIKPANWTEERQALTVMRCIKALDAQGEGAHRLVSAGNRPYIPKKLLGGKPCYLEEREPGFWIATGGAKNGTIAAGWCAHEIGKAVQ